MAPLIGGGNASPLLARPFYDQQGQISPDGRWVAFTSNESGRREVYVQDFPRATQKRQVSAEGGIEARWRGDGRELFYISGNRKIMAADVRTDGAVFHSGPPRTLFDVRLNNLTFQRNRYVVSPDGKRFLIITPVEEAKPIPVTVVVNWQQGMSSK